jgi:acyl-CoA synthetase (AMP-forming)/AMP-acid ligase II
MLGALFDRIAAEAPDACALADGPARISFGELRARAERMAFRLVRDAGIGPGDRIAVALPNGWQCVAGFLAAAGLGAVWTPLHPEWRARERAWYLAQVTPRLLLTRRDRLPERASDEPPLPAVMCVDDPALDTALCQSDDRQPARAQSPAAPVVCFPTSGSTGRPRIAVRTHGNVAAAARAAASALGVRAGVRELAVMPFHHSGGFDNCMVLPLLSGMMAVLQPAFDPARLTAAVAAERVQVLMGSPFIYAMLVESGAPRAAFASVATAISFGAPMPAELVARCARELGLEVRQLYGATETGVIAVQAAHTAFEPGLVGHPVRSVEVALLDEDGTRLEAGRIGMVAVRGPGVIAGYEDRAPEDRERFLDGWFRTGDLGRIEAAGAHAGALILAGRTKAMINIAGTKVDPVEIEHVIGELPEVRECAVTGVGDATQGEIIEAVIVLREGRELARRAVIAHCRQRLAEYKLPRRILFRDSLGTDASGKRRAKWSAGGRGAA